MANSKHPCLEVPPHLTRRDAVLELPKKQPFFRRLLGGLRK